MKNSLIKWKSKRKKPKNYQQAIDEKLLNSSRKLERKTDIC